MGAPNSLNVEEHDNILNAKRVNVVAGTITASSQVTVQPLAAWPDPKTYIGLVTITGSLAAAAGNVTLDKGSLTGLVGNVTLSDSKGYIGLVTTTPSQSWPDPKGFIGLVTVVGATGNTGNVTLNPGPNYIGLVTVKASITDTYASLATFTISLASIASSTTGVGRQSTLINNTSTKYTSANVYLKLVTGGLSSTPNSLIYTYLIRYDGNTVADDGAGASDAGLTVVNASLLGTMLVNASTASTAYYGVYNTAQYGSLGPQWGIAVVNSLGAPLSGTEGNMLKNWVGLNPQLG